MAPAQQAVLQLPSPGAPQLGQAQGPAQRMEADQRIAAELARLDAAFRAQSTSSGLALIQGKAQALLQDQSLADVRAKPQTSQFECRASQCRLVADFPPGADPGEWLMRLNVAGSNLFGRSQIGQTPLPGGGTRATGYFSSTPSPPSGLPPK